MNQGSAGFNEWDVVSDSRRELERKSAEVVKLEERQLLLRHIRGEPDAFPELLGVFRARVYSYLVRCGISPEVRDDLFQEIFIKIHRHATQYNAELPLDPWIFTIVANTVRSHFRKARVDAVVDERGTMELSTEHDTHQISEAQETARWLEQELQKLPLDQREAVTLCCIKDLSQADVAQILQLPVNTVKTHLRRGRSALAQALARRNLKVKREASI